MSQSIFFRTISHRQPFWWVIDGAVLLSSLVLVLRVSGFAWQAADDECARAKFLPLSSRLPFQQTCRYLSAFWERHRDQQRWNQL